MNIKTFVESLTIAEMNELSNAIYDKRRESARQNLMPLIETETVLIIKGDYITAIKSYRARLGSSLLEARMAIDNAREMKRKEIQKKEFPE